MEFNDLKIRKEDEEKELLKESKNLNRNVCIINKKVKEQNIMLDEINTASLQTRLEIEDHKNLLLNTMKELKRDGRTTIILILVVIAVFFTYLLI